MFLKIHIFCLVFFYFLVFFDKGCLMLYTINQVKAFFQTKSVEIFLISPQKYLVLIRSTLRRCF